MRVKLVNPAAFVEYELPKGGSRRGIGATKSFWTAAGSKAPRRFENWSSIEERCRRYALPPQSKILRFQKNTGQKPFDGTGRDCYVVVVSCNLNLNLLLNALRLCRAAVGF